MFFFVARWLLSFLISTPTPSLAFCVVSYLLLTRRDSSGTVCVLLDVVSMCIHNTLLYLRLFCSALSAFISHVDAYAVFGLLPEAVPRIMTNLAALAALACYNGCVYFALRTAFVITDHSGVRTRRMKWSLVAMLLFLVSVWIGCSAAIWAMDRMYVRVLSSFVPMNVTLVFCRRVGSGHLTTKCCCVFENFHL